METINSNAYKLEFKIWSVRKSLTELNVVAFPVEDLGATENSVIFKVGSSDGRGVIGNDQKLAVALSQRLLSTLEA